MNTILAPVDFSDATGQVLDQAARIASLLEGNIILLNVTQPPVLATDYGPIIETIVAADTASEKAALKKLERLKTSLAARFIGTEIVAADTASEKAALKKLERLKTSLAARFIGTEIVHRRGAPASEILDEAKLRKADYIVIGSHGHTALFNLLVGSTTHGVLRDATCPVVVVPIRATEPSRGRSRKRAPARAR